MRTDYEKKSVEFLGAAAARQTDINDKQPQIGNTPLAELRDMNLAFAQVYATLATIPKERRDETLTNEPPAP